VAATPRLAESIDASAIERKYPFQRIRSLTFRLQSPRSSDSMIDMVGMLRLTKVSRVFATPLRLYFRRGSSYACVYDKNQHEIHTSGRADYRRFAQPWFKGTERECRHPYSDVSRRRLLSGRWTDLPGRLQFPVAGWEQAYSMGAGHAVPARPIKGPPDF